MEIGRRIAGTVRERLAANAAVVLLGPRQVGKTTLARELADDSVDPSTYLDLERPADRRRLADPDAYLRSRAGRLVILDEVQREPGLFEVLRGVIDDNRRAGRRFGQFLLLGSGSLDLVHLSESLAGRVAHLELGGVDVDEAAAAGIPEDELWLRGGYPESLLAESGAVSLQWRADLIRSYLERDVPMFAPRIPAETLGRLWTMLAHSSGGLFNASRLAESLGISGPTVDRYVDLLAALGLIRRLTPWHPNVGKRLTKAPKIHVRDSGLLHALLDLRYLDDVLGHPVAGASFESFAVESLIAATGRAQAHHYRTARGDEVDLVLVRGGRPLAAIKVKRSTAPAIAAGTRRAFADLDAPASYVVHPETGEEPYDDGGVTVVGLTTLTGMLRSS